MQAHGLDRQHATRVCKQLGQYAFAGRRTGPTLPTSWQSARTWPAVCVTATHWRRAVLHAWEQAVRRAFIVFPALRIPDAAQEAVRSLVRCRADLVTGLTQTKQRAVLFVQARGYRYGAGTWTRAFRAWITALPLSATEQLTLQTYLHQIAYLEQEISRLEGQLAQGAETERYRDAVKVLMAFRGLGLVVAMTLACELGDIRRFAHPRQLMAYVGLVPSEHSSGDRVMRGGITKAGNTQARKVLVSTAWKYAAAPRYSVTLRERQQGVSAEVIRIAWKAQCRLHKRFRKLILTKPRCKANVALARELAGFLWEAMHLPPTVAQVA